MGHRSRTYGEDLCHTYHAGECEMIKPMSMNLSLLPVPIPSYRFLVTRIGCGIAGFTDRDIAPLFCDAVDVPNIALPLSFWHVIFSLG